jgi:ATP phosphoribosyltransferase involved in histidine biosynthesis
MKNQISTLLKQMGYERVYPNPFAPYKLFLDNKDFLHSDEAITFGSGDGVYAFLPDVTLGLAAAQPKEKLAAPKRVYYHEKVYRLSDGVAKGLDQLGAEIFGEIDNFLRLEMCYIAAKALECNSQQSILILSHTGYGSSLAKATGLSEQVQSRILSLAADKNRHDLELLLEDESGEIIEKLKELPAIEGVADVALVKARQGYLSDEMDAAVDELAELVSGLRNAGVRNKIYIDFSMSGNLDYYDGIVFSGIIPDVAGTVMSGGSYKNLLNRLGSENGGLGFALRLDLLRKPTEQSIMPQIFTYADATYKEDFRQIATSIPSLGDARVIRTEKKI